jgi:hypothetical protein
MATKIVYIAHPIGGDLTGNLEKLLKIIRNINLTMDSIVPLAPYVADVFSLDDTKPAERYRGLLNDYAVLCSGMISELWIYGERVSPGMRTEIELTHKNGIPVYAMTSRTSVPEDLSHIIIKDYRHD